MCQSKPNLFPSTKERLIISFNQIDPLLNFTLGRVNQTKADGPITPHIHPNSFEIVYIVKGEQIYTIDKTAYTIKSGECFLSLPNEKHGSGNYPEDKSFLYYLILPSDIFTLLGFDSLESNHFRSLFLNPLHRVFVVDSSICKTLESLIKEGTTPTPLSKTRIKQLLTHYLLTLVDHMSLISSPSVNPLSPVLEYIENHITEAITIQDLYPLVELSESRFKAYFREVIGIPPAEYILRRKISFSKELLAHSASSITDIAYTLSFSSSQYFSTVFKRFTTLSPSQYRTQKN